MYLDARILDHLGPMHTEEVQTDDGTLLRVQCFGPAQAPAVVFANGIGVRFPGAARQVAALKREMRIICWDYRGMGDSRMADPEGEVDMPRHALDILTILDELRIDRALFIGWSMGVQVSLEVLRKQPERVAGFVALLGTYGQPFRTGLPRPLTPLVEGLFGLGLRVPPMAQALLDLGAAFPGLTFAVLSRLLFMGRDADPEVFAANVSSVQGVDKRLYLRTMLALAEHSALDVLPSIRCPSLIICGERDYITPPRSGLRMARAIPGAIYREVTKGTHFSLIEQHELINGWLVPFAREALSSPPRVENGGSECPS